MSAKDGSSATIVLATRVSAAFQAKLAERYELVGPLPPPFAESVATVPAAEAARARVVITMGTVAAPGLALAHLPALGLVCCVGSGFEGVDLAHARNRRIVVTHSPAANASAVADLAVGLMIATVRRIPSAAAFLRRGDWKGHFAGRFPSASSLTGRKVGIYGLGAIGERIASRALALETEVGYHNRRPRGDVPYRYFASLLDLASWADVLVVAVRADAGNRHAVNAGVLAALGPQGHVVNIARGWVIEEAALVRALQEGTIAGVGLDVYEHEPAVPAELLALDNVALTPHIAGNTLETDRAMREMVCANIAAFLAGQPVPNPVPGSLPAYPRVA
ncbi:MAG: 2-hydroxyacid dehydrogenase [Burkholderiales bacterium]|nr:2-hydroxyacid dehydrogenase [Burkholderiales bacterium]